MKRFFLAAAFFAVLVLLWDGAYRAKIWSPVLLPSPGQVVRYLESAVADGTLLKATVITMRRLVIGYLIGLLMGLPLGATHGAVETVSRHNWDFGPWLTNIAQRLLGAACALVVRPNRSGDAFRSGDGNSLVGDHRNRDWCAQCSADLSPRGVDYGIQAIAHVVQSNPACRASLHRQRNETRLGICLAVPDGG